MTVDTRYRVSTTECGLRRECVEKHSHGMEAVGSAHKSISDSCRYGRRYLGAYTLTVAVEYAPCQGGYRALVVGELLALSGNAVAYEGEDGIACGTKPVEGSPGPRNERFGSGCRSLDTRIGHIVEHGDVAFVANADNDRKRELGHVCRKGIVIERREVAHGSAATYQHHAIELAIACGNGFEGSNDTGDSALAL